MNSDIILSMGTRTYVAKMKWINEEGGYYLVQFPSLKGCITVGNTIDEALAMAKDALECYLYGTKAEGVKIPTEKKSLLRKRSSITVPISIKV